MNCIECKEEYNKKEGSYKCMECKNPMCIHCHHDLWETWVKKNLLDNDNLSKAEEFYYLEMGCTSCYTLSLIKKEKSKIRHKDNDLSIGDIYRIWWARK